MGTEHAAQPPTAIGVARPGADGPLDQPEIRGADDRGDAEGGSRLLAAFVAMTDIKRRRLAGDLVAHGAALAPPGERLRCAHRANARHAAGGKCTATTLPAG